MIMLIALLFWLCWTPFYAVTAVTQLQTVSFLHKSQFLFTMLATHWAGFVNSCLNPLIYAALSNNFRRGFKQVDFYSLAAFNRTVKHAGLSAFLLCNCARCVLFIAFMFLYRIFLSC